MLFSLGGGVHRDARPGASAAARPRQAGPAPHDRRTSREEPRGFAPALRAADDAADGPARGAGWRSTRASARCCCSARSAWWRCGWCRSRCSPSTTRRVPGDPRPPGGSHARDLECRGAQAVAALAPHGARSAEHCRCTPAPRRPFNFNGLVRHYFLRRGAERGRRAGEPPRPRATAAAQSHAIAVAVRPAVDSIARRYGASAKMAEIPPGPPVLSTLVAEVYAADDSDAPRRRGRGCKAVFEATPGVVDVDWTRRGPAARLELSGGPRCGGRWRGSASSRWRRPLTLALGGAPRGPRCASDRAASRWPSCRGFAAAERRRRGAARRAGRHPRGGPTPLGRFVTVDSHDAGAARACARICGR